MGKTLIQQARGKGGPSYRAPTFRNFTSAKLLPINKQFKGKVIDFAKSPAHSAPMAEVELEDGSTCFMIAPEGIKVGDEMSAGTTEPTVGNTLSLKDIPEGTLIYNIESSPGDGGKFCRTSGSTAKLTTKTETTATIILPSKKEKTFDLKCRAIIGTIAGGGRVEKPFLKAGTKHFAKRLKNKRYPMPSGAAQNAVDHPFGNKRTSRKAKQRPAPRFAPAGRKVGKLHPKRTGQHK